MYERFSKRCRKVIDRANQEARRWNHEYIGTEHLLLALTREESGTAMRTLESTGIKAGAVRQEIKELIVAGPEQRIPDQLPQTPRAKKAIEFAIEEARDLNHNSVDDGHLLLGLIREREGVAGKVLARLGVSIEIARITLKELHNADDEQQGASAAATARDEVRSGSPAWPWAVLLISALGVAGSVLLSLALGLKACPLCFYQRSFAMGVLAVVLVGLVADRSKGPMYCLLALPLASAGLGVAAFHEYLVFAGRLECPSGLLGLGTAPDQSFALFVVLTVAAALGARRRGEDLAGYRAGPLLAAGGLGLVLAWLSIVSAPPMPPAPAQPYDPIKQPLDTCRPPFRPA